MPKTQSPPPNIEDALISGPLDKIRSAPDTNGELPNELQLVSTSKPFFYAHPVNITGWVFISLSPLYNLDRFFSAASEAKVLVYDCGKGDDDGECFFAVYVGSGSVAANAFLSSIGTYSVVNAYHDGRLRKDSILTTVSFGTALSDVFMAAVLATTPWTKVRNPKNIAFTWFSALGIFGSSFCLNLAFTSMWYARLSTKQEDITLMDQLRSLSYHLAGRSDDEIRDLLPKLSSASHELNIQAEFESEEQFVTWFRSLSSQEKSDYIAKFAEDNNISLWDDNSTVQALMKFFYNAEAIISAIALFYGPYVLILKLFAQFGIENDSSFIWAARSVGGFFGIFPIIVKTAVYSLLWFKELFRIYHCIDTARNVHFMFEKSPWKVSIAMIGFGVLLGLIPLSGIGFHKAMEDFNQFLLDILMALMSLNLDSLYGKILKILANADEIIGTINACVINNSAVLGGIEVVWGAIQQNIDPQANLLSKVLNGEADSILKENIPETTVAQLATNAVIATASAVGSTARTTASTIGSATYAAAAAIGSGIYYVAKSCAPSSIGEQQLLLTGNSCSFFSNSDSTRRTSLLPSIIPGLLPRGLNL